MKPDDDIGIIGWALGFLGAAGVTAAGWFTTRLDKKVSKDVFAQYEKRSDEQHAYTQNSLLECGRKMDRIIDKMDGKQDKKTG